MVPLFILADLEPGGAQRVILTVVRHLDRKQFAPQLCLVRGDGPLAGEIPGDIPVHDLKARKVRYALPGILKLCRAIRPNSVISTLGHLNISLLAVKAVFPSGTRLIVREANTPSMRLKYTKSPLLYGMLYRLFYPLADRVICNSMSMKNDLVDGFQIPEHKTMVIPNPVDTTTIHERMKNDGHAYGPGKYHLVSVGRLHYQKGFDLLLQVFRKVMDEIENIDLTIVGSGPEEASLRDMVQALGMDHAVDLIGHRNNPFPYMAEADLFVSASRYEGSPNAVLESLTCGTPVVAFDCPGGTGEIIDQGANGWLVPFGDIHAMGHEIVRIINGKLHHGMKDEVLLPKTFHHENVIKEYEQCIMSAVC